MHPCLSSSAVSSGTYVPVSRHLKVKSFLLLFSLRCILSISRYITVHVYPALVSVAGVAVPNIFRCMCTISLILVYPPAVS